MKTSRKIFININSKNIPNQLINKLVDGSSISPSTAHSCPPTNIRDTNIKNPPPPSSKPKSKKEKPKEPLDPKPKESLRSEEEDFLDNDFKKARIMELPISQKNAKRLLIWSLQELEQAIDIFNTLEVKKDAMGLLLDILKHPEDYEKRQKIKTKEDIDKEKEAYIRKNKTIAIKMAEMYKNNIKVCIDFVKVSMWDESHNIFYWDEHFEKILNSLLNRID